MALFARAKSPDEIALADRARDGADWDAAARYYRQALVRNPENPPIWVQLGHALKEGGRLLPAEAAYRRAIEAAPMVADSYLQLGHVLKLQNRLDEAKAAYLNAAALDPRLEPARRELEALGCTATELNGNRSETAASLAGARKRRRLSVIALGDRARDLGQWREAAQFYQRALDRSPGRPEIWIQYGHVLKEAGRLAEAERAYRSAMAFAPSVAETCVQLGHLLKIRGDSDGAKAAYLQAFAIDPDGSVPIEELRQLGWDENELAELRLGFVEIDDVAAPIRTAAAPIATASSLSTAVTLHLPDPATMPNRQNLRNYLVDDEFGIGHEPANRVLDYFRVVEAVRLSEEGRGQPRAEVLAALLGRMAPLARAAADRRPIAASVIVPVYNRLEYTAPCVLSILEHQCDTRFEIIVADDCSTDETAQLFGSIGGLVRCISTPGNCGFLLNCNFAAHHARGAFVVLLNNDTFVLDNWLDELLAPFGHFKDVGLVGSKLLMADGRLQEAGGIIWHDATGWNFGRDQNPRGAEFNYLKDADYISGAAIAMPKPLWNEFGGFDVRYIPAYAEDTDMAFRVREKGRRTLYAPRSEVIHHEGVSHGTDISTGIKAYQVVNQQKFVEKWRETLAREHFENGDNVFLARDRSRNRKHIIVFDHYVPKVDRDGGSRMMYDFLRLFVDAGLQVSFWPDNGHYDRDYAREIQSFGVEILYGPDVPHGFKNWIGKVGPYLDYAFLHRPNVSERYINDVAENSSAKRIFYGGDLHFLRLEREYALTGRLELLEESRQTRRIETYVWDKADVVYYPAPEEVALVREMMPHKRVQRFPVQVYSDEGIRAARQRVDEERPHPPAMLYVAGFAHRPNVDAILWFAREVLPLIKDQSPESVTFVAGSYPPRSVTNLGREDVIVTQAVSWPMLDWLYNSAQVVIAPIRYGGGMKGKILEAMRYGVPVVTTGAGAEGFDQADEIMAVEDTPEGFAEAVVRVLRDRHSARRRVLNALDYIDSQFSYTAVARRLAPEIPELSRIVEGRGLLRR